MLLLRPPYFFYEALVVNTLSPLKICSLVLSTCTDDCQALPSILNVKTAGIPIVNVKQDC